MGLRTTLFGPTKEEIWRQLAEQINAGFVDGGFFGRDKVIARCDHWIITLDTYTVSEGETSRTYTRMRAPYVNADNFRFTIYPAGLFTPLANWLGMRDIEIGDPPFDESFVIKGTNETKVRTFFTDPRLKDLIRAQIRLHLEVKDDEGWFGNHFPDGVDELYFRRFGVMRDLIELRNLFDLFTYSLQRLCQLGSAYEDDPGITL